MNAQHAAAPAVAAFAQIATIATQATSVQRQARKLCEQLDEVRAFVAALNEAAQTADRASLNPLYWPALMSGLLRLLPSDEPLEGNIEVLANAIIKLNEAAAREAAQAAPAPGARAKRTRRAALACSGHQV
jgi:hypothetical protein